MFRKLVLLLFVSALSCGLAQADQIIKISHQFKAHDDIRDQGARLFAKTVSAKIPDIKFRIYPGGSLIHNPVQQLEALQNGTLEMSVYPIVYGSGKVPGFSIGLMPNAISGMDEAIRLKHSKFHDLLQNLAHANGVHIMTWWWEPAGYASKTRPIHVPKDVNGMKMRGAGPYNEILLKAAGASVVSMPSSGVYSALQTGVINALLTSCESFMSFRVYEQTRYATAGGQYTPVMVLEPLLISLKTWKSLTPEQQKVFEAAADKTDKFVNSHERKSCEKMAKVFKKAGNEVTQLNAADYQAWEDLAKKTAWVRFKMDAPQGEALLNAIQSAR